MTTEHVTEPAKKSVLILGATGTVGEEVTRACLAKSVSVRALVRSEASAQKLPPRVEVVRGDLRDEGALERAMKGMSSVFYVSPHEADEEELAARVVRACEKAGARLVFVGVHVDGSRVGRAFKRFMYGRMLAHYAPKFRLSEYVRTNAKNAILLMPPNFFQNDELFIDEILSGTYRIAFDKPVNRVDVRDLGEAAARALTDDTMPGGAYPVEGPESLTGAECAAIWGEALGRPVRYDDDRARFDEALARKVSGKKLSDFSASFGILRNYELRASEEEMRRTVALLGRAPTRYRDYVKRRVAELTETRRVA